MPSQKDIQEENKIDFSRNIYEVLAEARITMPTVFKGLENGHFRSTYASIDIINRTIVPHLAKYGLFVMHKLENGFLKTRLHYGDQFVESETAIFDLLNSIAKSGARNELQAYGSALTYLKRYHLTGLLSIDQSDDDNDAGGVNDYNNVNIQPVNIQFASPESIEEINKLAAESQSDINIALDYFSKIRNTKYTTLNQLHQNDAEKLISQLKGKVADKENNKEG